MDLFTFFNDLAQKATTSVGVAIGLALLVIIAVAALKSGLSIGKILGTVLAGGFLYWAAVLGGFKVLAGLFGATLGG